MQKMYFITPSYRELPATTLLLSKRKGTRLKRQRDAFNSKAAKLGVLEMYSFIN